MFRSHSLRPLRCHYSWVHPTSSQPALFLLLQFFSMRRPVLLFSSFLFRWYPFERGMWKICAENFTTFSLSLRSSYVTWLLDIRIHYYHTNIHLCLGTWCCQITFRWLLRNCDLALTVIVTSNDAIPLGYATWHNRRRYTYCWEQLYVTVGMALRTMVCIITTRGNSTVRRNSNTVVNFEEKN